ncbi:MAG: RHS repeat-associated core domain-containing protein [Thermoleophilaceae bacterium]|nr:RHS repeat-associated core domain-containing protein [Thermoleophilaceae bacterium]
MRIVDTPKKEDGAAAQGFLYAPGLLGPVTELNADGNPEANFIYATRSTVPDYMVRSGHEYRLITDQVGSVRMVVDAETGSVEQAIDYDAFGRVLSDSNPGFQPFGFAGGIYDRDTKLTHFGAREYDAELGRWTSSDPIGFAGGDSNLYRYVLGDPVNISDPNGLYVVPFPGRHLIEDAGRWLSGAAKRAIPNFGTMCGQSYLERVGRNTLTTNERVVGLLAPPGFSMATAGGVAELLGTTTLFKWAFTYPKRPPIWGPAGGAVASYLAAGGAFVVGTGIGSLATSAYMCGCS